MELKGYLRIMMANWWIFLATFAITFGAVLTLTGNQTPVYESVITYVVRPNLPEQDVRALASAVSLLSDDQVERTIAQVAKSQSIRSQAASALGFTSKQIAAISVSSRVLPGTDVVEIVVQGPDPVLTRDVASVIGPLTTAFLQGPNWLYALVMLDPPTSPSSPIQPKWMLNLLAGAIAAMGLGAVMALLLTYLQKPAEGKVPAAGVAAAPRVAESLAGLQGPVPSVAAKYGGTASAAPSCSCPICSTGSKVTGKAAVFKSAVEKKRKP